jgi:hypothetical protein
MSKKSELIQLAKSIKGISKISSRMTPKKSGIKLLNGNPELMNIFKEDLNRLANSKKCLQQI